MIRRKVTSKKLTLLPISPGYTVYNFSQEHHITSAHMETLDHFLGSRNQSSLCLNLKSPLATRQFTAYTSQSLLERITWLSRDFLMKTS